MTKKEGTTTELGLCFLCAGKTKKANSRGYCGDCARATTPSPGPWAYHENTGGDLEIDSVYPGNGDFVCTVFDAENNIANARLITAAPDLLSAAMYYVDKCKARGWHQPGITCSDSHCDAFRSAILKAQGETK